MQVRNPVDELKDTRIWQYLNGIDPHYAKIASKFVETLAPILDTIKEIFPLFTRHDAHHSFRILLRIQQIVYKECFESTALSFSADESLLLICAAYGHDLGMAVFPDEEKSLLNDLGILSNGDWRTNTKLHTFLRENHSKRGGSYILKNVDNIGLPLSLVSILDKLMESHNLSINELDSQLGSRYAAGEKEVELKQLACIFCIADSLEFSETRVVEGVLDLLKGKLAHNDDPDALLSYRHNMQSVCIGDNVAIGEDGKVIFSGTFTEPDTLSLAHNSIDLIENWLRSYNDIDFQSKMKRLKIRSDSIIRELSISDHDFIRIGIRIKKENIIDLISSNSTWTNDSAIVLRELLQNSVEACRYRKFHSSEADIYVPKIDLFFDTKERSITISDNGCGMSRNIILNNFLTVGNSRSFEPSYTNEKYSSLARFGIGFWSVFTVADKAQIETGPFEYYKTMNAGKEKVNGVAFEVSIKEFKDYTVFRPIGILAGTKIKLFLKHDFNFLDALYRLTFHIGCSEIPLEVHFDDKETSGLTDRLQIPSMKEVFGAKIGLVNQYSVKEYCYKNDSNEIDTEVKIFYCHDASGISFLIPGTQQMIFTHQDKTVLFANRGAGICGFLFNHHVRNTIIDFFRIGIFTSNARNPKGYQFMLNRMGILPSPIFEMYESNLAEQVHNCYRELISKTGSNNPQAISRLNHQSRMNGGELHGEFTHGCLDRFSREIPDLIAFKIYKISKNTNIASCEIKYLFYNELIKAEFNLWLYATSIHHPKYLVTPQTTHLVYDLLKQKNGIDDNSYLLEPTREADMLADCSINYIVYSNILNNSNAIKLPIRNFRSLDTDPSKYRDFIIAEVKGIWSGTIVEREIVGTNIVFIGQHHLIVSKGSLLASDIKKLYAKKMNFQICEIVNYLQDSNQGFVDESIRKYI
ncbi:MAG TPA: ATP-binding protein [Chitinophagaceae bacterium]|jgi:hypothetical protein|nr:ATP-binding protein [Chitinophagaceae bacterium]